MKGQVFKVISDSYLVCSENNQLIKCKAKGTLKLNNLNKITVGDYCVVEDGVITSICQRKNKFIRPNVANIDVFLIVVAPTPAIDWFLVDKVIINAIQNNVQVIIAVNKSEIDNGLYQQIKKEYQNLDIEFFSISALTGEGIDQLKQHLKGKTVVLAGQSAVGKTSIVNKILGTNFKTGILSQKIERGKHTTTFSEIFVNEDVKIVDSPGFAAIDAQISAQQLKEFYPEYENLKEQCRFRGCNHINEPDCAVKEQVKQGVLSQDRYLRYKEIYKDLLERRDKNYGKN